jgi:methyl-accepting chemotaxis protein
MVAMPFGLGKLFRTSSKPAKTDRRARLGIRGSLFLAFTVIAATSVMIAGGASYLLRSLDDITIDLSKREIPRMSSSQQLSTLAESLASRAPALMQVKTDAAREEQLKQLKSTQAEAMVRIKQLAELKADPAIVSGLEENVKNLDAMINSLNSAARERLETTAARDKQFAAMREAHAAAIGSIDSAITDAKIDVNAALGDANAGTAEVLAAMNGIDKLNTLLADVNLLSGNMSAAPLATTTDTIEKYKDEQKDIRKRVENGVAKLGESFIDMQIKDRVAKLLAYGAGKTSIYALRAKEIDDAEFAELSLEEARKLSIGLDSGVKQLVETVQTSTDAATQSAHSLTSFAILVMIAMGSAAFIGSLLFVWLYVGRNILRRIGNLQSVMRRLAEGDLAAEVMASKTRDEVAEMAKSLEVFRESMVQSKTLAAEQDKDRATKAERTQRMEARIANFEETVRAALDTLMTSAGTMQSTAEAMSGSADRSSALASAVASAAEETSVNVQTVSSGTEELSSSIEEISRQVASSTQVANKAVSEATATDTTMQGLADSAARISTVVDLIQTIASQTNLLALNATIEAARAGESGRGFAVVASEVKSLADQTAKATDEIRSQIASMQDVTTNAVGAIRHIGQTIAEINEVTTAIAAAVEEQGAATREIARNIQQAATGTTEVSSNIVGVSEASSEAGSSAADVLTAAAELRKEAESLRQEIDGFLSQIRAA